MPAAQPVLSISGLQIRFPAAADDLCVLDDVGFSIAAGETLALVGESGSGKSVTSLAVMRLLARGRIACGSILFRDRASAPLDLATATESQMRTIRGKRIGMIFQEPMSALNPVFTIGSQIAEAVRLHEGVSRRQAWLRAVEMLERVGVSAPAERAGQFPHQISGGMRQRVMIAMALSCRPSLLIADEPTTALDVTIQAQILDLLRTLQAETGMAILFITHNLALVSEIASRVVVMYAGQVVEQGAVDAVFSRPRHPYTRALLQSLPGSDAIVLDRHGRKRLRTIPGRMHPPFARNAGCAFESRCAMVEPRCRQALPPMCRSGEDGHLSRCLRSGLL